MSQEDLSIIRRGLSSVLGLIARAECTFVNAPHGIRPDRREMMQNEFLHAHDTAYEFTAVYDGRYVMNLAGSPRVFENAMILLAPGVAHHERPTRQHAPYRSLWLVIRPSQPGTRIWVSYFSKGMNYPGIATTKHFTIAHSFPDHRLLSGFASADVHERRYTANIVENFLIDLERQAARMKGEAHERLAAPDPTVEQAIADADSFIETNVTRPITVSDVASHVGYSTDHITRLYKKRRWYTMHQHINAMRLSRATELLLSTDRKIVEIARDCGFYNANYFNAVFRERYTASPSVYRRLNGRGKS